MRPRRESISSRLVISLPFLVAFPIGSHPEMMPARTQQASFPYTFAATLTGTEPIGNIISSIFTFSYLIQFQKSNYTLLSQKRITGKRHLRTEVNKYYMYELTISTSTDTISPKGGKVVLIQCPECELNVSDKALACPHCGCPMTKHIKAPSVRTRHNKRRRLVRLKIEI